MKTKTNLKARFTNTRVNANGVGRRKCGRFDSRSGG